jgi:hypothetical protein
VKSLGIVLLLSGCGHFGVTMPADEVAKHGTKIFEAPMPKVYDAVATALESQGWKIPEKHPETGFLRTSRRAADDGLKRRYEIELKPRLDGSTRVIVRPHLYRDGGDVSDQEVWVLDGNDGERVLWRRLFRGIRDQLGDKVAEN